MQAPDSQLVWCVVTPTMGPHARLPSIGPPTTAQQIAEFRARVLYDAGRRPSFRREEGGYDDADPLDRYAFQIAVRRDGDIIGCIRANPTSTSPPSSMAKLLGAETSACAHGTRTTRIPRAASLRIGLLGGAVEKVC
jgi:hypothetical protein